MYRVTDRSYDGRESTYATRSMCDAVSWFMLACPHLQGANAESMVRHGLSTLGSYSASSATRGMVTVRNDARMHAW